MATVPRIGIHQIHFLPEQKPHLEPAFRPYDNAGSRAPREMEYGVFVDAYDGGLTKDTELTGFVSWKFGQKTQIRGEAFLDFMGSKPGCDVYFINPFPGELVWKNLWLQGDHFHPGLVDFAQKSFDRLGYGIDLGSLQNNSDTAAYCNYWVGNARFWDKYMAFSRPIYQHLLHDLSAQEQEFLWQRADRKINASYFPFLFERMFSTLLATDSTIKALGYRYSEAQLKARYQPHIAGVVLANYHVEDGEYEAASERLLGSYQSLRLQSVSNSTGPRAELARLARQTVQGLRARLRNRKR